MSRHLDRDEMLGFVRSLDPALQQMIAIRESRPFLGSVDAAVLASLTAGGAAVAVSLINGLFLLWSQNLARRQTKASAPEKPVVVVRTPSVTINVRSQQDVPTESEIDGDIILEIRLNAET
ncbi:MAG TPA: hypothetical protein VNA69_04885 [Thermoanaerobaculia bacterium]|nr:hypothetical protein [Thermoanaerobaculia bacterium]